MQDFSDINISLSTLMENTEYLKKYVEEEFSKKNFINREQDTNKNGDVDSGHSSDEKQNLKDWSTLILSKAADKVERITSDFMQNYEYKRRRYDHQKHWLEKELMNNHVCPCSCGRHKLVTADGILLADIRRKRHTRRVNKKKVFRRTKNHPGISRKFMKLLKQRQRLIARRVSLTGGSLDGNSTDSSDDIKSVISTAPSTVHSTAHKAETENATRVGRKYHNRGVEKDPTNITSRGYKLTIWNIYNKLLRGANNMQDHRSQHRDYKQSKKRKAFHKPKLDNDSIMETSKHLHLAAVSNKNNKREEAVAVTKVIDRLPFNQKPVNVKNMEGEKLVPRNVMFNFKSNDRSGSNDDSDTDDRPNRSSSSDNENRFSSDRDNDYGKPIKGKKVSINLEKTTTFKSSNNGENLAKLNIERRPPIRLATHFRKKQLQTQVALFRAESREKQADNGTDIKNSKHEIIVNEKVAPNANASQDDIKKSWKSKKRRYARYRKRREHMQDIFNSSSSDQELNVYLYGSDTETESIKSKKISQLNSSKIRV